MTLRDYIIVILLFVAMPIFATGTQKNSAHLLGDISFPTSGNKVAESNFITGVLLLHSFEYDRARVFFNKLRA